MELVATLAARGDQAGLRLDQLVLADRLSTQPAEAPPAPGQPAGGWIELLTLDDVRL